MPHPGCFSLGEDLVPIVWEAGWDPGPVWTGMENLTPPLGFDPRTIPYSIIVRVIYIIIVLANLM